jgi:ketosteroid isomerase-like protein
MTTPDALAVAERLFAAIPKGDIEAVRALYATDAVIWHNFDQKSQTPAENLAVLSWVVSNIKGLRYEEIQREATLNGFIQQHVLRGTAPNGSALEVPACIVCTVKNGRITRLDEYLDTAQLAPLSART